MSFKSFLVVENNNPETNILHGLAAGSSLEPVDVVGLVVVVGDVVGAVVVVVGSVAVAGVVLFGQFKI